MRVAGKTDRPSTGRRYHSATSSPAPGALPESLGQPPNLLGGWAPKPLRHGFPKLACDWFAPCERKFATTAILKDQLKKMRVCPMRVVSKTGRPSLGHRYRSATSSPAHTYLFADNRLAADALGGRTRFSYTLACSLRATSEPTHSLGGSARKPPLAISRPMWTLDANLLQPGVPPEGHKLADLHARGLDARKYGLQVS